MLGIPGTWQGASSEQGMGISCDPEDGMRIASIPTIGVPAFCTAIG